MTCQTCAALRTQLDEANEKIIRLELALGAVMPFPALLGLTPTQERILSFLVFLRHQISTSPARFNVDAERLDLLAQITDMNLGDV